MQTNTRQFPSFYEMTELDDEKNNSLKRFFITLAKSTGIFFLISFIVFFIVNYQFVKSQIVDWSGRGGSNNYGVYLHDKDKDNLPDWWEEQYGLNMKADDSKEDQDGDYANNLVEHLFGTDPTNPDTDEDGYFDGEEIKKGYNPTGEGRLDADKDQVYDWWEQKFGFSDDDNNDAGQDIDNDGLSNLEEFLFQTDPRNADSDRDGISDKDESEITSNPMSISSSEIKNEESDADNDGLILFYEKLFETNPDDPDSDADGFSDFREASRGYNPAGEGMIKGQVKIPAINVEGPIIWAQSEENEKLKKDLESGIVHYPATAFPGMRGNSYITGHSSYYAWSSSQYKEIFKDLEKLKIGDKIIISLELASGKKNEIVYAIRSSESVAADDYRLFRDFEGFEMTLVTCWPLGTDWKRWMVKADLESPKL